MIDVAPIKQSLFVVAMTMPRLVAVFGVIPFLGRRILHGFVRNSIILSFVLILYPLVLSTIPEQPLSMVALMAIIGKEIVIGLLLGFLVSIIFWVAEGVGFFIDNQRGATMASLMDPMSGAQTSPLGSLFLQLAAVMFFSTGGFLVLLSGLFESYRLWPIFSFFPRIEPGFGLFFLKQVDFLMKFIVLLAAPVVIAIFVSEFGLGLINRFAPQLNVFFLSMPIKSGISAVVLILYLGTLAFFFKEYFTGYQKLFQFLGNLIQ